MFHTVASENVEIAIGHFKRAIALDPSFALAHCGLGTCYLQRVIKVVGSRADIEAAASSFDHALALDPYIVDARAYRAFILRLEGEVQKSRDQMIALRRDAPHNFEVQYLSAACYRFDGDYENSFRSFEEMLRIDPTAQVAVHYCRARIFWYEGKFDEAFAELGRAEKIEPHHPIVKFFYAILTFQAGDPELAAQEMKSLFSVYPREAFRPYLSMCLSAIGDRDAARRELTPETEQVAEVDPDVSYWLASANLMIGDIDRAFEWLRISIRLGNHNLRWFEKDPVLEPMRSDRRFPELIAHLRQSRAARIH